MLMTLNPKGLDGGASGWAPPLVFLNLRILFGYFSCIVTEFDKKNADEEQQQYWLYVTWNGNYYRIDGATITTENYCSGQLIT